MKFDWELGVIWIGLMFLIVIPIHIYMESPISYVMGVLVGVVLTAVFLKLGMLNKKDE